MARPKKTEGKKEYQYRVRLDDKDSYALELVASKNEISKADAIRKGIMMQYGELFYKDFKPTFDDVIWQYVPMWEYLKQLNATEISLMSLIGRPMGFTVKEASRFYKEGIFTLNDLWKYAYEKLTGAEATDLKEANYI